MTPRQAATPGAPDYTVAAICLGGMLLIAFITWLVVRAQTKRQQADQELSFKKAVYADAANVVAEGLQTLWRAMSASSTEVHRAYREFNGRLGKLLTIAPVETQKAALRLNEQYIDVLDKLEYFTERLGDERAKQLVLDLEMKRLNAAYEVASEKLLEVLISSHSIEGQHDMARQIKEHQKTLEQRHAQLEGEHTQSVRAEKEAHLTGTETLLGLLDPLHLAYADLLVTFRRELRLKSDETWFKPELEKNVRKAQLVGLKSVERARGRLAAGVDSGLKATA